jgi:hypothetical protein
MVTTLRNKLLNACGISHGVFGPQVRRDENRTFPLTMHLQVFLRECARLGTY